MPPVDRRIVKERAARLRAAGEVAHRAHLDTLVGTAQRVLVEREGVGRTEGFALVATGPGEPGTIVETMIAGHDGQMLVAADAARRAA